MENRSNKVAATLVKNSLLEMPKEFITTLARVGVYDSPTINISSSSDAEGKIRWNIEYHYENSASPIFMSSYAYFQTIVVPRSLEHKLGKINVVDGDGPILDIENFHLDVIQHDSLKYFSSIGHILGGKPSDEDHELLSMRLAGVKFKYPRNTEERFDCSLMSFPEYNKLVAHNRQVRAKAGDRAWYNPSDYLSELDFLEAMGKTHGKTFESIEDYADKINFYPWKNPAVLRKEFVAILEDDVWETFTGQKVKELAKKFK